MWRPASSVRLARSLATGAPEHSRTIVVTENSTSCRSTFHSASTTAPFTWTVRAAARRVLPQPFSCEAVPREDAWRSTYFEYVKSHQHGFETHARAASVVVCVFGGGSNRFDAFAAQITWAVLGRRFHDRTTTTYFFLTHLLQYLIVA